jgi:hypothetical protein
MGVEHFGQTGTIGDLYRHHGIDADAIVEKVNGLTDGKHVSQGNPGPETGLCLSSGRPSPLLKAP